MNNANKLTIVIQTFNRLKGLGKALKSILNQSCKEFNCIIYDNGSSYNSEIHNLISGLFGINIKVITKDRNIGLVNGRNDVLKFVETEFVARLDDDDELDKDFVKELLISFKDSPDCIFINSHYEGAVLQKTTRFFWRAVMGVKYPRQSQPYSYVLKTEFALSFPYIDVIPEDVLSPFAFLNKGITIFNDKATINISTCQGSISNDKGFFDKYKDNFAIAAEYWSNKAGKLNKKNTKMFIAYIWEDDAFSNFNYEHIYSKFNITEFRSINPFVIYVKRKLRKYE